MSYKQPNLDPSKDWWFGVDRNTTPWTAFYGNDPGQIEARIFEGENAAIRNVHASELEIMFPKWRSEGIDVRQVN